MTWTAIHRNRSGTIHYSSWLAFGLTEIKPTSLLGSLTGYLRIRKCIPPQDAVFGKSGLIISGDFLWGVRKGGRWRGRTKGGSGFLPFGRGGGAAVKRQKVRKGWILLTFFIIYLCILRTNCLNTNKIKCKPPPLNSSLWHSTDFSYSWWQEGPVSQLPITSFLTFHQKRKCFLKN